MRAARASSGCPASSTSAAQFERAPWYMHPSPRSDAHPRGARAPAGAAAASTAARARVPGSGSGSAPPAAVSDKGERGTPRQRAGRPGRAESGRRTAGAIRYDALGKRLRVGPPRQGARRRGRVEVDRREPRVDEAEIGQSIGESTCTYPEAWLRGFRVRGTAPRSNSSALALLTGRHGLDVQRSVKVVRRYVFVPPFSAGRRDPKADDLPRGGTPCSPGSVLRSTLRRSQRPRLEPRPGSCRRRG